MAFRARGMQLLTLHYINDTPARAPILYLRYCSISRLCAAETSGFKSTEAKPKLVQNELKFECANNALDLGQFSCEYTW